MPELPAATPIEVRVVGPDELDELIAVRRRVFGGERDIAEEIDVDGTDAAAVQVGAYSGAELIGTGRVLIEDGIARIGRMAVDPRFRSHGIGARVLRRLEIAARRSAAREVQLNAMAPAYSFYVRAGYVAEGEEIIMVGHPHQAMRKRLPVLRPGRDSDSEQLITIIGDCFAEYPGCVLDVDGEEPWLRRPASAYAEAGGALWVYTDGMDGPVIASGAAKPTDHERDEVKSMYVSAAARRQGLAQDLVGVVEDWVRSRGKSIHLWTDTRFLDAHRLYEGLGYVADGQQRELHDKSATVEYHYVKVAL